MQDNQSHLLQSIILEQFNLDNQTNYGDNYNVKKTLGNFQNQYLDRVYLTMREGVYLQHHKAFCYDADPIEVSDDILLIDLGDQQGKISMIRLYQPDRLFADDGNNDLKLVSYHISYTS